MIKKDNQRYSEGEMYLHEDELYEEKTLLRKKRRSRFRIFIITLVIAVALILLYFAARSFFSIDTISINGNSRYKTELIIEESGIAKGGFMFGFASSAIEERICMKCPYIEKAKITREYPSTVRIDVTECTAEYYTSQMNRYIAFSADLKVLEVSNRDLWLETAVYVDIPDISTALEGKKIAFSDDGSCTYITAFISELENFNAGCSIDRVDLRDSFNIKMLCDERFEVLFGKDKELNVKMKRLSMVIMSETVQSSVAASIDISDPDEPRVTPYDKKEQLIMNKL